MRTAKCLIIVLALVAVAAGQETPTASCIVRITADPTIIPLNPGTIESLIASSAVAGKAAHNVLGPGNEADVRSNIEIEWLAQGLQDRNVQQGVSRSTGRSTHEDDMMRQLAEIYGDRYAEQMRRSNSDNPSLKNGGDQQAPTGMMGAGMMGGGMMGGGMMGASMMGGGGMGGMMGGGMGAGMGGYGVGMMGGAYGSPSRSKPDMASLQTATFRLSIGVPASIKQEAAAQNGKPQEDQSVADSLLSALVENLRQTLLDAYETHAIELKKLVELAESRREQADRNFAIATGRYALSPERRQIAEQLETFVDLSMLSPEMPFSEAIEYIKNAVEPPLPIVVLWKELLEDCEIEPTTPIDMDGLHNVKLKAVLKTLLQAVSGSIADISYQIDDDVIVIREEEEQAPVTPPSIETDARDLAIRRRELTHRVQQLEMDFAITEARRRAIEEQIARVRDEANRKMEEDAIIREMKDLLEMSEQNLHTLAKQADAGRLPQTDLAKARESVTRAKIELARRREELATSAGGNQLNQFNDELSQMAIDTAAKRAELEFLHRQLAEAEVELTRVAAFDPQAAQIRIARQTLDVAETHETRLKTQLARLQPPTVTIIGAN